MAPGCAGLRRVLRDGGAGERDDGSGQAQMNTHDDSPEKAVLREWNVVAANCIPASSLSGECW